jgi:hypothetical protein
MAEQDIYLRAILATVARQTFPPLALVEMVAPPGSGEKQLVAYNMCDGSRSQGEIAKSLSLDAGNFSRTISRWIDIGIIIKVGEGRPLHVYPLPNNLTKKVKSKDGTKE